MFMLNIKRANDILKNCKQSIKCCETAENSHFRIICMK